MRILLIGEFSRLHNSLKEGLEVLGHEVVIVGNGDGFKNYNVDFSTKAKWCETKLGNIPRQIIYRISKFDIARIEFGIRFLLYSNQFKNFDVVQFINEKPIQTVPWLERFLIRKIIQNNKKTFLLCCGVDYTIAKYMMAKTAKYTIMNPYFENPKKKEEYLYIFDFLTKQHKITHDLIYKNTKGVIASDMDYAIPLKNNPAFLGLIPNPVNLTKIEFSENKISEKIIIFHGINRWNYLKKGTPYFEEALKMIQKKHGESIEIITAENIPYNSYIQLYNKAHIVLDQVFAYDQGYNALEAMAKGKVVFTGAESEFETHYNLTEKVAINALPNVEYLVQELTYLIENPEEITKIGKNARLFIEKTHDYVKVAKQYLTTWNTN